METLSNCAVRAPWLHAKAAAAALVVCASLPVTAAAAPGRPDILWSAAGHAGTVTAVDLSPDGTVMATSSDDSTLKLWRYPAGNLLRTVVLPYDIRQQVTTINQARFTPDGARVVAAMNRYDSENHFYGTVDVFRVADGSLVREFGRQAEGIASIDVSPDGRWIASAGQSKGVMIWRAADGTLVKSLQGDAGPATDVHFSPAGDRLNATYADHELVSWRTSDWSLQWSVAAHDDTITRVAVSPDGTRVATASVDGTAKLFEADDGTLLHTFTVGSGLWGLAFSPDGGDLATGGFDGVIRQWDVEQGTLMRTFHRGAGSIHALRYAEGGQVLLSGSDFPSLIQAWNTSDGTRLRDLTLLSSTLDRVQFSADSERVAVAATNDSRVDVFNARSGRRLYAWNTHTVTEDVAFSPDNRLAATPGPDNSVIIRRLSDGKVVRRLVGHAENVVGLAFSHDGTLLASGSYFPGTVRLWRTSDWSLVRVIQGGSDLGAFGPFMSFSFSPDDSLLGTVAEAVPIVLRVSDGTVVARPAAISRTATFSPDGQLFAVSGGVEGAGVEIYRVSDWTLSHTLPSGATGLAFAADGSTLLAAHDDALRIWRTSDWTVQKAYGQELGYGGQGVQSVSIAPDGTRFAYGRYDATLIMAKYPKYRAVP